MVMMEMSASEHQKRRSVIQRRSKRVKHQISAEKAKAILHDGKVHGKPLTDRQRRYMGAMSHQKGT